MTNDELRKWAEDMDKLAAANEELLRRGQGCAAFSETTARTARQWAAAIRELIQRRERETPECDGCGSTFDKPSPCEDCTRSRKDATPAPNFHPEKDGD